MREAGFTYAAIGTQFGVGRETIYQAVKGNNWRHIR